MSLATPENVNDTYDIKLGKLLQFEYFTLTCKRTSVGLEYDSVPIWYVQHYLTGHQYEQSAISSLIVNGDTIEVYSSWVKRE